MCKSFQKLCTILGSLVFTVAPISGKIVCCDNITDVILILKIVCLLNILFS